VHVRLKDAMFQPSFQPRRKQLSKSNLRTIILLLLMCLLVGAVVLLADILQSAPFESPMADQDVATFRRTLKVLTAALDSTNVSYFMTAGTLLGSFRHHGRIPWDDDADLSVRTADKEIVWNTLTALFPNYGLFLGGRMESWYHWKFYP